MMRLLRLCLAFVAVVVALANGEDELPEAEPCNPDFCQLPACQCSSTTIPGKLATKDTPQFVTFTFNDAVTVSNIVTYRQLLYDRKNSKGCNIGTTFFVRHEYTNYHLVNELYNKGFEIALNSISHRTPQAFWAEATYEDMVKEFADQRTQMSYFANIPVKEIKGLRTPYLQTTGNASFQVVKDYGLLYDSSWSTVAFQNPGLWPYTLDYATIQDCPMQPCPTASIPGVWVSPLITWQDLEGFPCSFVDGCVFFPDRNNEEAWFQFILENFERHYLGTRAPFNFAIQQAYITSYPAVYRAIDRFINLITRLPDVFMVNESEVVEWSKNPVSIVEYRKQDCRSLQSTFCPWALCALPAEHNDLIYYMSACTPCPRTYPWVGNPLGR